MNDCDVSEGRGEIEGEDVSFVFKILIFRVNYSDTSSSS
jgi:hypothetical protein